MSCHKAAKQLGIAYNNAKVIYRIFKKEGRINQTPKQLKRHAKIFQAARHPDSCLRHMDDTKRMTLIQDWRRFKNGFGGAETPRSDAVAERQDALLLSKNDGEVQIYSINAI